MKTNFKRTLIAGLVAAAVVTLGVNAFAGRGMGAGGDDRGYHHYRGGDCPYMDENLTTDQREQLDAERQAFLEATKDTRQDLYAKRLELRAEMAKSDADLKKASALQQEISDLQGNLDQKRLNHIMAMRKINPDAGRWFAGDCPRMGDRGMGRGLGGHGGGGHCRW